MVRIGQLPASRFARRLVFVLLAFGLLATAGLVAAALVVYHHPTMLKAAVERAVGFRTGTKFRIQALSFDRNPWKVSARGLTVRPAGPTRGFELDFPQMDAVFKQSGTFGHRRLLVEFIRAEGWRARLSAPIALPELPSESGSPSIWSRMWGAIVRVLLFEEIEVGVIEALKGTVRFQERDQALDLSDTDVVLADGRLEILCRGLYAWPSREIAFTAPVIRLVAGENLLGTKSVVQAEWTVADATFACSWGSAKEVDISGRLLREPEAKHIRLESMDVDAQTLSIGHGAAAGAGVDRLTLSMDGALEQQTGRLNLARWVIRADDFLDLSGCLDFHGQGEKSLDVRVIKGEIAPYRLVPFLAAPLLDPSYRLTMDDGVQVTGNIEGKKGDTAWTWQLGLETRFSGNRLDFAAPRFGFKGRIDGSVNVQGALLNPDLSAGLEFSEGVVSARKLAVESVAGDLSLTGKFPNYRIDRLNVRVPRLPLPLEKAPPFEDVRLALRDGLVNVRSGAYALPRATLSSSQWKHVNLSAKGDRDKAAFTVEGRHTGLVAAAAELGLPPPGWQVHGDDTFRLTAECTAPQCRIAAHATVSDFGFENAAQTALGERISLEVRFDGTVDLDSLGISGKSELEAGAGEVLYDRFYFDLSRNAISAAAAGDFNRYKSSWRIQDLSLALKNIAGLHGRGSGVFAGNRHRFDLSVKMPETAAPPLFEHFAAEPYQLVAPSLASVTLEGAVAADLRITGEGHGFEIVGRMGWRGGGFVYQDKTLAAEGIDLDLPIWFTSGNPAQDARPLAGQLNVQTLILPVLGRQALAWPILVAPGRIEISSATRFAYANGTIELGPMRGRNVYRSDRTLETDLTVKGIETDPILKGVWPAAPPGEINGTLKTLALHHNALAGQGRLIADVFGGQIIFSAPAVSDLFSSVPRFETQIRIEALDLEGLTAGTGFGTIRGRLSGAIEDFKMASGQPQRFRLTLETERKRGVPQKISVKAVENISQIGGGRSPFVGLAGRLAAVFKEFDYRKIGVRAALENDVFRINGTIRQQGVEYLVKGGGIPSVNVVNKDPDNRVSFKDMVKRLHRVIASPSGPIVK